MFGSMYDLHDSEIINLLETVEVVKESWGATVVED